MLRQKLQVLVLDLFETFEDAQHFNNLSERTPVELHDLTKVLLCQNSEFTAVAAVHVCEQRHLFLVDNLKLVDLSLFGGIGEYDGAV